MSMSRLKNPAVISSANAILEIVMLCPATAFQSDIESGSAVTARKMDDKAFCTHGSFISACIKIICIPSIH